jgi:hypothetical protein
MRKIVALFAGVVLASSAKAAVVTYTLRLHESASGQVTSANQFAVYATVSQGDNAGLFAYGLDLTGTGDAGGPTTMTLVNRTPNGTWDADPNDLNYDPSIAYPTKFAGFGAGRSNSPITGIVSGVQDLSKDTDLVRLYGVGQTAHRVDEFRPPPDTSTGVAVAYGPYSAAPSTDGGATAYGNPSNPAGGGCGGSFTLPAGTVRIATGSWTGAVPSIQQLSVNTKASVWKLNHPNGTENEIATLQFALRDLASQCPVGFVSLSATGQGPNVAVGGAVVVSGSNNSYSSEVDQLLDPSVNRGNAPIQTIGDEAGVVYVMAKLSGTSADIAALLASTIQDVDATDSQFAALHAIYDSQFGAGGFNVLFKFPNFAGAKVFNWDFSGNFSAAVTIDQVAAVPEPSSTLLLLALPLGLLRRRRAARV